MYVRLPNIKVEISDIPLSPMYVPYPPRAPPGPTWPTFEMINGKTEYASLTPNGVSRELSTCSFRERKLGGKLGKLGGKLGKEKLNGQDFEQRDKETRINAGRFLVLPSFATSASDDQESDLTRPVPFGSADNLVARKMCSSRRVISLYLSLSLPTYSPRRYVPLLSSSPTQPPPPQS